MHVLHNSEQPAAVFALLESPGPPPKTVPLVADGLFDLLMIKMATIYNNKKQTRMEARGARFEFADFLIKIGTVTMSQNFKGVLVEVSQPFSLIVRVDKMYIMCFSNLNTKFVSAKTLQKIRWTYEHGHCWRDLHDINKQTGKNCGFIFLNFKYQKQCFNYLE